MDNMKDMLKQNENDIEIVDLDEHTSSTSEVDTDKRFPLKPRFSSRQRHVQLVATIGIVVLLLAILVGSYTPTRSVLFPSLMPSTPTPLPRVVAGTDYFFVDVNPPWGKLSVDNKLIMRVPFYDGGVGIPMWLSRGTHVLSWNAPPFPPMRCSVSVPPDYAHDTCYSDEMVQWTTGFLARLFRFPVSLDDLPDTVRASLVQTTQNALDAQAATTTMAAGTPYATTTLPTAITWQSLQATLHFQLDTNLHSDVNCSSYYGATAGCTYNRQDCRTFCSASDMVDSALVMRDDWIVLGTVQSYWDYRTFDGKVVALNQPDIINGAANDHFIPLKIEWDGTTWHVTPFLSALSQDVRMGLDPMCNAAEEHSNIDQSLNYIEHEHSGANWSFVSGSNLTDGCLGIVTLDTEDTLTPSPTVHHVAYVLHRFGVFLAANDVAHNFWPDMPLANADEQRIAQHLYVTYKNFMNQPISSSANVLLAALPSYKNSNKD